MRSVFEMALEICDRGVCREPRPSWPVLRGGRGGSMCRGIASP